MVGTGISWISDIPYLRDMECLLNLEHPENLVKIVVQTNDSDKQKKKQ
jgi:hypothetical protein